MIKIGAPKREVTIPTGTSIGPDLAIKSAVLKVKPPIKAEKGRTYYNHSQLIILRNEELLIL